MHAILIGLMLLAAPAPSAGKVRDLEPIGDVPWCVESYSTCTKTGGKKECTSARLEIPCGETKASPHAGSKEQLRCVCK